MKNKILIVIGTIVAVIALFYFLVFVTAWI